MFDPNLGRFLSVDPVAGLGSQRLNPYSYLMNSPLSGTDPTGYDACPAEIGSDQAPCQVTVSYTPTGSHIVQNQTYTIGTNGADLFITAGGSKTAEARVQGAIDRINSLSQTGQIQGAACVGSCHGTESNPLHLASAAANPRDRHAMDLALGVGPISGEVSSGYELLTGHTMASDEEASRGWAAVGLATFGLGKYLGKTEELVDLYHGTSREAAQAIREGGIDLSKSRAALDFGAGFYTTTDLRQAQKWASSRFGDAADILHFQVPVSELSRFRSLNFSEGGSAWEGFVRANRAGAPLHDFDIVSGPFLKNPGRAFNAGASGVAQGQQMSFHTQAVIDMLNSSLVGH